MLNEVSGDIDINSPAFIFLQDRHPDWTIDRIINAISGDPVLMQLFFTYNLSDDNLRLAQELVKQD